MSSLEKLTIRGIRNFGEREDQVCFDNFDSSFQQQNVIFTTVVCVLFQHKRYIIGIQNNCIMNV